MPPNDSPAAIERTLERARSGDSRAWSALVEQFESLVYSIPRRMGLSSDDASDVFQSTFLALYRHLDRIDNPATLPKWLSVTASRECLRLIRTSAKTTQLPEKEGWTLDELIADEDASAEEISLIAVRRLEVSQALLQINERCRNLLMLLYSEEGKEYREIADELSMPIGAIGPTRARCLEKLRSALQKAKFFDRD